MRILQKLNENRIRNIKSCSFSRNEIKKSQVQDIIELGFFVKKTKTHYIISEYDNNKSKKHICV